MAPSYWVGGPFRLAVESMVRGGILEPVVMASNLDESEGERLVHHLSRHLLRDSVPNYQIPGDPLPVDEIMTEDALADLPAAILRWRKSSRPEELLTR